jgi:uncharacterized protein YkwD
MVSLVSFSQEMKRDTTLVRQIKLEKLVLQYINDYRVSLGIKPVKWDDKIYVLASHQAHYLSYRGVELSHFQTQDRPNHTELRYLCDGVAYFKIDTQESIECLTSAFTLGLNTQKDYEDVAHEVVNSWINSIAHRNGMIQSNLEVGVVSIYLMEGHYMRPVLVMSEYK